MTTTSSWEDGLMQPKEVASSPDSVMFVPYEEPIKFDLPPAELQLKASGRRSMSVKQLAAWLCMFIGVYELCAALVGLVSLALQENLEVLDTIQDAARELGGVAVAGFVAQLVDGALGMGYGITSSSVLVAAGLTPTVASASVHLAQLGTTAASGFAHWQLGNIDAPTVVCISPPGIVGAFLGATTLSSIHADRAKPVAAALLFGVGLHVLHKFHGDRFARDSRKAEPLGQSLLLPLGFFGGFIDATGGGGWGPVATSGLLADGRLPPAKVIGTVSASEFFVTVAAVGGFLLSLGPHIGGEGVRPDLVLTLLLAGLLAAPIAPMLVTRLRPQLLGTIVGGFISITNARVLLRTFDVSAEIALAAYAAIGLAWAAAVCRVITSK